MVTSQALEKIRHKTGHLAKPARDITPAERPLAANLPEVTQFFQGGLHPGDLIEWGLPWGQSCRDIILSFIAKSHEAKESQPLWCLWIHGRQQLTIYPPAWQARGLRLSHLRFAKTRYPLRDLKPVLMDPFFKMIIFDGCSGLTTEDCQFLAQQARRYKQIVMILRDYELSARRGNVWAKIRVNCWRQPLKGLYYLQSVKGLPPRQLTLKLGER